MAGKVERSPKSPRYSLPWAVDKMLILLEKEGVHPVAPDIMAQHLGYTNARNGRAATILGTLRMYGLILKDAQRKDVISEDVKKFKYTPYAAEKSQLVEKWLKSPKLFSTLLAKYPEKLPSDQALKYELIQEFSFTEEASRKFIKILRESIEYAESFEAQDVQESEPGNSRDIEDDPEEEQVPQPDEQNAKPTSTTPSRVSTESFSVQITGPGMNSVIEIKEEEDLMIVEAMLKKVSKKVFSE